MLWISAWTLQKVSKALLVVLDQNAAQFATHLVIALILCFCLQLTLAPRNLKLIQVLTTDQAAE